jgi:hypothetical protein
MLALTPKKFASLYNNGNCGVVIIVVEQAISLFLFIFNLEGGEANLTWRGIYMNSYFLPSFSCLILLLLSLS